MMSSPFLPHALSEGNLSSVENKSTATISGASGDRSSSMLSFLAQLDQCNGRCRENPTSLSAAGCNLFVSYDKAEEASYVEAITTGSSRGFSAHADKKKFQTLDEDEFQEFINKQRKRKQTFAIGSDENAPIRYDEEDMEYPPEQLYSEVDVSEIILQVPRKPDLFAAKTSGIGNIVPPLGAPALTPPMLKENRDVLERAENTLVVQVGPHRLYRDHFAGLKPRQWLEDQVIDLYLELIKLRSQQNPATFPKVYIFASSFYALLGSMKGLDKVRNTADEDDILSYDLLLIPVCRNYHWRLIAVDIRNRRIHSFNSLGSADLQIRNNITRFLAAEETRLGRNLGQPANWAQREEEVPLQGNCHDCGVFLLQFANYLTRRQPFNFEQKNMPYFRQLILYECAHGRLL